MMSKLKVCSSKLNKEAAKTLLDHVKYLRCEGKNELAFNISLTIAQLVMVWEDLRLSLQYEISILAYYQDNSLHDYGLQAIDDLLFSKQTSPDIRQSVMSNLYYYVKPLAANYKKLDPAALDSPGKFLMNPSICSSDKATYINIRRVNFQYDLLRNQYVYSNTIDTENFISIFSQKEDKENYVLVKPLLEDPRFRSHIVNGYEDMRLIHFKGELYGLCTSQNYNENCYNKMVLIQFGNDTNGDFIIVKYICLDYGTGYEKNWMPFISNDKLCFLYSHSPLTVLYISQETINTCNQFDTIKPSLLYLKYESQYLEHIRGGSQLIKLSGEGYLYVTHEISVYSDEYSNCKRRYYHRFLLMSEEFKLLRRSDPFYLIDRTVEFVSGLTLHDNKIKLTFGFEDKEAYITELEVQHVLSLLVYSF